MQSVLHRSPLENELIYSDGNKLPERLQRQLQHEIFNRLIHIYDVTEEDKTVSMRELIQMLLLRLLNQQDDESGMSNAIFHGVDEDLVVRPSVYYRSRQEILCEQLEKGQQRTKFDVGKYDVNGHFLTIASVGYRSRNHSIVITQGDLSGQGEYNSIFITGDITNPETVLLDSMYYTGENSEEGLSHLDFKTEVSSDI